MEAQDEQQWLKTAHHVGLLNHVLHDRLSHAASSVDSVPLPNPSPDVTDKRSINAKRL